MSEAQKFSHHEGDKSEFEQRGLRSYFEYRDLGIADASTYFSLGFKFLCNYIVP